MTSFKQSLFSFSNLSSFGYLIVQLSRYCCICALSERQLDNIITLFSHCQQKLLLFLKKLLDNTYESEYYIEVVADAAKQKNLDN